MGMLFAFSSCRREEKERAELLCQELENTPLLTSAFDSLVALSYSLPKAFRAKVLLMAGSRYKMRADECIQSKKYLKEAYRIARRDLKARVGLELTRLYGILVLQSDCVEEAAQFMGEVSSKVVFTREEEACFYYLRAKFFKSVDIDRAFADIDRALFFYRSLSDVGGEVEVCRLKGALYGVLEDYENQYACYEQVLPLVKKGKVNERFFSFYEQMAASLKKLGRYREALGCYEEILRNRKDAVGLGRYGIPMSEAYMGLGESAKARKILKQRLEEDKRVGVRNLLYGKIAASFMKEGVRDSALVYLEIAIDSYGRFAHENDLNLPGVLFLNYLQYAQCLWEGGMQEEALQYLERMSRENTDLPEGLVAQVKLLKRLCEYYEVLDRKRSLYGAYRRLDSVEQRFQSSNLDKRAYVVLQKYKNKKLLLEIEQLNQKREATSWWLVLSLVMTIGVVVGVLVYTCFYWNEQVKEEHGKNEDI